MELRTLKYFLTVAKEENISKAANVLHLTQPTLSRQLMDLENELGIKLFIRGNRKVQLTDEGKLLCKRAEEIMTLVDKTEQELNHSDTIINGDIYIGGGETDAIRLIAKTAQHLQRKYPNIKYHIFSGNADDVTERLDKGLLDFGILIEPTDFTKDEHLQIPTTDTWGLLMRKDSNLASKQTIKPKDLKHIPLIISRQSLVDEAISNWLTESSKNLNIIATYNLIFNASLMVEEGMGYALCLDKLVNTTGDCELCFIPLSPPLESKLSIVWKKNQILSKASQKFLQALRNDFSLMTNHQKS